ncbi:MAG: SARP family transcriptional regulator, partial [Gammaproteobacteria bacterium]|nr:SARP family transcriptional regulator [Gemmatimonadota bacterium]NIU75208.1 SARP family transcriptional regulator [Gammaproteobacteria bacterium]
CALLVYLAMEREASRDTLLGLLWPDRPEDRARHTLNQTLYELRRLLGDDWAAVEGDRVRIAEHVTCDAVAFERAVAGQDADQALELYAGAFL